MASISPAAAVLRALDKDFINTLGAPYQGTTHTTPDLSHSVQEIIRSCCERKANLIKQGKKAEKVTCNIIRRGTRLLQEGTLQRFLDRRRDVIKGIKMDELEEDDIPPMDLSSWETIGI